MIILERSKVGVMLEQTRQFRMGTEAADRHQSLTYKGNEEIGCKYGSQSSSMASRFSIKLSLQSDKRGLPEDFARPFFGAVGYGFGMPETEYGVWRATSNGVQLIKRQKR